MKKLLVLIAILAVSASSTIAQEELKNWFHTAPVNGMNGVASDTTYAELLKDKTSTPVVVAIIDSGVDIEHEDLSDNIWINTDEIPNNGIDDDNNGYIDDVNGWNFIGGPDGKNVGPETYEVTRLYGKYKYKFESANPKVLNKKDKKLYDKWLKWKEEVDSKRAGAEAYLEEVNATEARIMDAFDALGAELNSDSLAFTKENIDSLTTENPMAIIGKRIALNVLEEQELNSIEELKNLIQTELSLDKERQQNKLDYAYNPDYDSRKEIVKDDYSNGKQRIYGNNDVEGPDALHGTHVAGIVGAVRNNDLGMNGVADNVQIMSVRAVPDGDERDKDVANAIRYAVDNGASIINMSFGKGYSSDEKLVEDAIRYAEKNDVLLVHAAGNSALNIDKEDNFPNASIKKGWWIFKKYKPASNWIEVGALSYGKGDKTVASFSNYGAKNVDLFSPGVKIYATVPNDKYRFLQGTSMAAPVVAGVATVLRSYFPALTAKQVKEILETTVVKIDGEVNLPGDAEKTTTLSKLSKTGGTVNLYNAVKKAMVTKGKKKIKKDKNRA